MSAVQNKPREENTEQRFASAFDQLMLAARRLQARSGGPNTTLSLAQYYILLELKLCGELPLGRLAEEVGIAPPTATRLLDGLEREGLIERRRPPHNRRTVLLSLTPAGRRRLAAKRRELTRRRSLLYNRLTPAEREQAPQLLTHLAELLRSLAEAR